jgi:hypothetical protein
MGDYRRLRSKYSEAKAELDALKTREQAAADKAHWDEYEGLKAFKLKAEQSAQEAAREAIRTRNANAILEGVEAKQRDDVALMLAGMQLAGKIDLYNEAENTGLKLREKLEKDRPGWFTKAPNGGTGGLPGVPGQGVPEGPMLGMTEEQLLAMSDEQFSARIQQKQTRGARP